MVDGRCLVHRVGGRDSTMEEPRVKRCNDVCAENEAERRARQERQQEAFNDALVFTDRAGPDPGDEDVQR